MSQSLSSVKKHFVLTTTITSTNGSGIILYKNIIPDFSLLQYLIVVSDSLWIHFSGLSNWSKTLWVETLHNILQWKNPQAIISAFFSPKHWLSSEIHAPVHQLWESCFLQYAVYLSTQFVKVQTSIPASFHFDGVLSYEDLWKSYKLYSCVT